MNKISKDLDEFEANLGTALRASGHLFPETDDEMQCFLSHAVQVTLPEKYQSPDFVFQEETDASMKSEIIKPVDFTGTAKHWTLAARNGKNLPQSILEKMKEDKKNSLKK